MSTHSGLATVPSSYKRLDFTQYSVFTPGDPALANIISEHDLNCAVSSPNALIGSRLDENGSGACFQVANASAMSEDGLQPYFTLHSFYIKPMDAPKPGTTIYIIGYSRAYQAPLTWHVDFPSGYHLPLLVKLKNYSGTEWKKLYKVEIKTDFGYDALDWEFCIDDLEVQFFTISENDKDHALEQPALPDSEIEI